MNSIVSNYIQQKEINSKYNNIISGTAAENYINFIQDRQQRKYIIDKQQVEKFVETVSKDIVKSVEKAIKV